MLSQVRSDRLKQHGKRRSVTRTIRWQAAADRARREEELSAVQREVEELLARDEAILNTLRDAVLVADLSGTITYMNPAALRMYGFDSLEEAQRPHASLREQFEILGPNGQPLPPEQFPLMRVIAGEQVSGFEMTVRRLGSNSSRVLSYGGTLACDETGQPLLAVVTARDVTQQHKDERDLRLARDELQVLLDVSNSLVSTLDLSRLLEMLVRWFKEVTGAAAVTVFGLAGGALDVLEYDGPLPRAEALTIQLPAHAGFAFPQVMQSNQPLYVEDLESDSPLAREWRDQALPEQRQLSKGLRSWLSLPLTLQERVVGVVRLAHPSPNHFSEETIRLAAGIANQAAVAIANARLHAEAQEAAVWAERERLARELHDSVSQILFGVDMATYSALSHFERNPARAKERLALAYKLNKTAQKEMRALIFELRTDTISTNGLIEALEVATAALRDRYSLQLVTEFCPEPAVSLGVKEAFFRVAVEALNNAGKHGAPGPVSFRLTFAEGILELNVVDSGPGFNPSAFYPGHLGLGLMRERASRAGAVLRIESNPGSGTRVNLVYPGTGPAGR